MGRREKNLTGWVQFSSPNSGRKRNQNGRSQGPFHKQKKNKERKVFFDDGKGTSPGDRRDHHVRSTQRKIVKRGVEGNEGETCGSDSDFGEKTGRRFAGKKKEMRLSPKGDTRVRWGPELANRPRRGNGQS